MKHHRTETLAQTRDTDSQSGPPESRHANMDIHQQQQFIFFLQTATERHVVRLEERFRGTDNALQHIRDHPDGEGLLMTEFVDALFADFLLYNADGACFVLRSLPNRTVQPPVTADTVEQTLVTMAKQLFTELLLQKTIESLEQRSGYQSI